MLSLEERISHMANEWNNELALLESCITSLGLDRSLTGKILQKATYESIETGRSTLDILREYRDKFAGFANLYPQFPRKILSGEIPVCKELSGIINRPSMNLGGNQSGGD